MRKLVRRVSKVNGTVVGMDVHQNEIAFSILDREGEEVEFGTIPSTAQAVEELLGRCQGPVHAAFEAGGSTFWVYDVQVEALGADQVHVAQPKKIRAIANSRQKNDANDAWWLAYLTHEGRLPESFIPVGELRDLRIAVRARFAYVQKASKVKVQIRSTLRQMGHKLPRKRLDCMANWNALLDLIEASDDINALTLQSDLFLLEQLQALIGEWDEKIEELVAHFEVAEVLQREIPGVGPVVAAILVAEIGPVQRFHSAKALACFTGLTPSDRSSGGRVRHGAITREGSEHLRWALNTAAVACLRAKSGPRLAVGNWIRAKQRRLGNKGKARIAGARKLAEQIWRLFHYGEQFDAARPFGGVPVIDAA